MDADTVARWLDEARLALPDVVLPDDVFGAAVAERASVAYPTDLYLACACALGVATAVRRFEDEHVARIPAWLGGAERDRTVIDEVCQRVRTRALLGDDVRRPRIADYTGTGPLGAWVRVIALREHASLRRDEPSHDSDERLAAMARSSDVSPELAALRERYRPLLTDAFRGAIAGLPPRDRTLLRLAYVDGLALDGIGRMYGVNKSTVSRWLSAARAVVLAAALASVRAELHASPDEAESLLGLVRSNLELSLHGLL